MDLHAKIIGVVSCSVREAAWNPVYRAVNHVTWDTVLFFVNKNIHLPVHNSTFRNVTLTVNNYIKKYEFK